jgi:hypothetical protein
MGHARDIMGDDDKSAEDVEMLIRQLTPDRAVIFFLILLVLAEGC